MENVGEEEDGLIGCAENEENEAVAIVKTKEDVCVLVNVLVRGLALGEGPIMNVMQMKKLRSGSRLGL